MLLYIVKGKNTDERISLGGWKNKKKILINILIILLILLIIIITIIIVFILFLILLKMGRLV